MKNAETRECQRQRAKQQVVYSAFVVVVGDLTQHFHFHFKFSFVRSSLYRSDASLRFFVFFFFSLKIIFKLLKKVRKIVVKLIVEDYRGKC